MKSRLLVLYVTSVALALFYAASPTTAADFTAGIGRSFASFAELRSARPTATGELVYLTSYLPNLNKGGGQFRGTLSSGTDDGGMVASNGSNFRWDRIMNDFEQLNVLHFGATHDGIVDDHDAVVRMFNYVSVSTITGVARNGIRFVAGKIKISPVDFTNPAIVEFALFGPTSPSPTGTYTTILSDGSNLPVFNVSARRTTIRGIAWDGQVTATVNPTTYVATGLSNVQPFFQNIETAGEFINVAQFYATRTGGDIFNLLDTLDTKFENILTNNTYSNFWNILWSNDPTGNWDHSTAVEAVNMVHLNSYGTSMLTAPRMAQGLLRNIRIENCRNPGTFENSQWIVDAFFVINCKEPFNFLSYREITHGMTLVNATVNRGGSTASWLSAYEYGYIQTNPTGIAARAPVGKLWEASLLRGDNTNSSSPLWLSVGRFDTLAMGGVWKLEVVSKVGYIDANFTRPTENGAGGKATIMMQAGTGQTPIVTWSSTGYAGVTEVQVTDVSEGSLNLWIKIAPRCAEYAVFIKSTGLARFLATDTLYNYFRMDGTTQTASPSSGTKGLAKASLHNGLSGFGAENGILTVDTTSSATTSITTTDLAGYSMHVINGKSLAVPYYHISPVIRTQPSGATLTAGNRLSLSVAGSYAVAYQWQQDSGSGFSNVAGATTTSYVVSSATSAHSGSYRVILTGSAGSSTAITSRSVTVTVS